MWKLLLIVALLDQNRAAPAAREHSGNLQLIFQQLDTTVSPVVSAFTQKTSCSSCSCSSSTSSSSSSSCSCSSSTSSSSSHSSEDLQEERQRHNLENTAVEQLDGSQESAEAVPSPSNTSTSLWLNELVLLGEMAGERDGERAADGVESRGHEVQSLSHHHTQNQLRTTESGPTEEGGGVRGAYADAELTSDLPDYAPPRGHHGDEGDPDLFRLR